MNYRETYAGMSDDEILNVAATSQTLVPEARAALASELDKRKLTAADITDYQGYLATVKPGDWPGKKKYVGQSYNGFGTGIYGKRDFSPDGSFVTTQWIILFWLPIIPIKSMRVLPLGPGANAGFLGFGWSIEYAVYSEARPNTKQVFCIYGFLLAILLSLATTDYVPWQAGFFLLGVVCLVPWLLRRAARGRIQDAAS